METLTWELLKKLIWDAGVFFGFFFILLYMKYPEITQKIKRLRESLLKIIELSIKFLWVSKINSALHGLSVLSFTYAHTKLHFSSWFIFLFSGWIRTMFWKPNQTLPTIQFKYKRICLTWKEKNNFAKKDLCNSNSWVHWTFEWKPISMFVWTK